MCISPKVHVDHIETLADMLSFQKKCGKARDDKLSTSNFHARAARLRHLHNGFKNSFQGDGMDNSNKHC